MLILRKTKAVPARLNIFSNKLLVFKTKTTESPKIRKIVDSRV